MGSLDFFSSLLAVLGILFFWMLHALLADHNYFDVAARIPRVVSNLGGVSGVHISEMTDGDDDDTCIAPTSTSLEAFHGGTDLRGAPGVHISNMTSGDDDTCTAPTSTS